MELHVLAQTTREPELRLALTVVAHERTRATPQAKDFGRVAGCRESAAWHA